MKAIGSLRLLAAFVGVAMLAGCDAQNPSGAPRASVGPTAFAPRPAVRIAPSWTASNGEWTFTGRVDPQGDSTDVVLDVGPGPSTVRVFDQHIPVAQDLTDAGPLMISTRAIPDIDEICVRFTATNSAGASSTTPLCFPHDLPSIVVDAAPPTTQFTAPATATTTVLNAGSTTVSWTEAEEGTSISARSLQRRAAAYTGGACGAYADDGPASTAASPVPVSGLIDGTCYQWVESLSDHAGNTSVTTSGTVRIDLGAPG